MAELVIVNPSSGDKTTSLFTDPDSSSGVVSTVEKGTILKVTGSSGNYYMVEYDNGKPNVTQGGTANTGTVMAYPYATMYSDTRKKDIAGNINNGTGIEIVDDSNPALIKVRAATTQGHLEGYIDAKYIYRDNEETPVMFRMTRNASSSGSTPTSGIVTPTNGLKCRTGPGTNYSYVGAFNYNAKLTIHESKNGWYRVTGTSGWGDLTDIWVSAQYVKVDNTSTQAAVPKTDTTPAVTATTNQDWTSYFQSYNPNVLNYTANDEYYRQLADKYSFALGAPPRYNMDIDIQYLDDISAAGRVVNKTILSHPAILSICPGKVQMFPNGKLGEEVDSIVDAMVNLAAGDSSLKDKISADDPARFSGKLYRFVADTAEYANYLNALCRSCAILLGIGDELIPYTSTKLKNFDYAYWTIRKKYNPTAAAANDSDKSIFRKFWDSLIDTGKNLVTTAVDNTAYINFFLNGSETNVSENISNSVADSPLASVTNTVSSAGATINYFTGAGFDLSDSEVDAALNAISNSAGSTITGIKNLAENFIKGGRMVLPKMLDGANYGKSISCNMKFVSPYGNKYSVFLKCIVPICHLLAMALPKQLSDNMYTFPFVVKCAQIGQFTVELGVISSLNITRGGGDDTSWSVDGLATEWEVQMEITPLVDDLMISSTKHPVLFCKNEGLLDYLSNFCGYDMISFNLGTKTDLAFSFIKNQVIDIPHSLEHRVSDKMMNLLGPFFTGAWS